MLTTYGLTYWKSDTKTPINFAKLQSNSFLKQPIGSNLAAGSDCCELSIKTAKEVKENSKCLWDLMLLLTSTCILSVGISHMVWCLVDVPCHSLLGAHASLELELSRSTDSRNPDWPDSVCPIHSLKKRLREPLNCAFFFSYVLSPL